MFASWNSFDLLALRGAVSLLSLLSCYSCQQIRTSDTSILSSKTSSIHLFSALQKFSRARFWGLSSHLPLSLYLRFYPLTSVLRLLALTILLRTLGRTLYLKEVMRDAYWPQLRV